MLEVPHSALMCTVIGTIVVFLWSAFRKLLQADNLYISKCPVPECASKEVNDAFWGRVKMTGESASSLDGGVSFYTQLYTNREEFRLKHFILERDSDKHRTHYLTMISIKKGPREDFIMVQMNELFGMPRGCVATWVQSSPPPSYVSRRVDDCFDADPEHVHISGFWGKFKNDDCEASTSTNHNNIFKGALMLRFFRKYSGFLSGVVLVRLKSGQTGWTCTSKNDAADDSKYVQDAKRIWNSLVWGLPINTSTIRRLYDEGVRSLWVETMSKRDQNHGAEVKNEGLVLTAMSYCVLPDDRIPFRKGTVDIVSMTNSHRIRFMTRINVKQNSKTSVDQSCEAIATKLQCQVYCRHSRLYCGSLVMEMEASGWSDESHMQEARDCLSGEWENGELVRRCSPNEEFTLAHLPDKTPVLFVGMDTVREYIPFDGLSSIVDTPITVHKPLIHRFKTKLEQRRNTLTEPDFQALLKECGIDSRSMHDHLLGSTLEGVVFQVMTATGEWDVIKYKFAPYVIRTMLLRNQGLVGGKYRRLGTVRTSPKGESRWCPSRSFAVATEDFMDRWVTRSDDNHTIRALAVDMAEQFDALVEESASNHPSEDALDDDHTPRPGWLQPQLWIRAADRVTEGSFHRRRPMSAKALQTFVEWHQENVHVVVVLGPIGIGKSTTACQLAKHFKCKHVDTDELFGISALKFSDERNAATISAIAQAAADGRVVVSTGGGPLGAGNRRKWECVLASQLEAMYPNIKVKMTVFLPSEEMGWSIANSPLSEEQLGRLFNNKQPVMKSVEERVKRGVWSPVIRKGEVSVRQFAEHIVSLSKGNLFFALKIQEMAGATCTYPPATGGNQPKLPKHLETFLDTHCALSASPQQVVMLQQLRLLYLVDDGKVVKHETLRYRKGAEEFPLGALSCADREDDRAIQTAGECTMVTVPGDDDTRCTILALQDAPLDMLPVQQCGERHVTIHPGKRPRSTMKLVAKRVLQGNMSCVQLGPTDFVNLEHAEVCPVNNARPFAFIGLPCT